MIAEFIIVVLVFGLAILMHEGGHYMGYRSAGVKPYFKMERLSPTFYTDQPLPKDKQILIILVGIIMGIIPIGIFLEIINSNTIFGVIIIGLYLLGCIHDFKEIIKVKNAI